MSVPEAFQELSTQTFWTKDELHYLETAAIKNQGIAEAFIRLGNREPIRIQIAEVKPAIFNPHTTPLQIDRFQQQCIANHPAQYATLEQIELERITRQEAVFGEALRWSRADDQTDGLVIDSKTLENAKPAPDDDDPFV